MRKSCFLFLFFVSVSGAAQRMLTLEEAIATALKNNFDIQLAKNDSAVAALDYSFRNAVFLPRVNGNVAGVWNNNAQKQRFLDGTQRELNDIRSNNYNMGVQLNWTLFDGMKMFATRDKVKELVSLGELTIKNQVINTVAAVITNYYNIVRQKQQLKAVEEQIVLSTERAKLAQYKLDIGVGAKPDVLQSKVDLNAQKSAQLLQKTLIAQLKEQLNQVMNVTQVAPYEVSDSIPLNMQVALSDVLGEIENGNPSLLIARKNIAIAGLTLKERKADRFPVISLNSGYTFGRNNNKATVNPFQPLYSRNIGRNIGLTVSVPLLNNFTVKRNIRQAELDIQYQQLMYNNQKSQVSLSVINAYHDYELQKRALALEEENILLAKENVNIVFQVYKLSSITLIQLKEAEKSLQDAYTRLINARYNTKLAETELLRLKGELVK
ncbi:MAG TPA: TolC family protein [Chitinophagaceae bacterium]|nr:TolC family protein [Chitinophagaceae bacterium]